VMSVDAERHKQHRRQLKFNGSLRNNSLHE
jgi:hypothetical protein